MQVLFCFSVLQKCSPFWLFFAPGNLLFSFRDLFATWANASLLYTF